MSFATESELASRSTLFSREKELEKPIVVYGAGRSGSTLFHSLLCRHPKVAWLSGLCQRYPAKPHYNHLLLQMLDVPGIGRLIRNRFKPFENYPFWEYYNRGFTEPCRDLTPDDLTIRSGEALREALAQTVTTRRDRLLLKITGWPRLGWFHELYPDIRFIHVIRDGRSVANSILNVSFWRGWMGPENWRWGPLPPGYEMEWMNTGRSFAVLAAIQWKILMDAAEDAKQYVSDENVLDVKYEDLCENPVETYRKVTQFCELEWTSDFEQFLGAQKLRAANYKWKEGLTAKQQQMIEESLEGHLEKYGYL